MKVIKIAQVPPPTVPAEGTVLHAAQSMKEARIGAAAVVDSGSLVGILSERDIMLRVVAAQLDPETTSVREVMTSPLETVGEDTDTGKALETMVSLHIRHLPVVDQEGRLVGLLSIRNLLQHHVDDLVDQLDSLEAYFTADGPGG